jgi:hypothetical protein
MGDAAFLLLLPFIHYPWKKVFSYSPLPFIHGEALFLFPSPIKLWERVLEVSENVRLTGQ